MYKADEYYGKVRMSSNFPTPKAEKFLNYFQSAGWHHCNEQYKQIYKDGIDGSLLIFTVGGKGSLSLNKKNYILNSGKIALIPSHTSVRYFTYPGKQWEFYWINLFGTYADQIVSYILEERDNVFPANNLTKYLHIVKDLIYLKCENKIRFEIEASAKIFELLNEIVKGLYYISDDNPHYNSLPVNCAAYLEEHYSEPVHLAKLSRDMHISQNQLIRTFKSEIGYTPYEYLLKYRLLKACELLQMTSLSVEEIGAKAGFLHCSNFISRFKDLYGVTPFNYRKSCSSRPADKIPTQR